MLDGIVRHQKKFLLILAAILIVGWILVPTFSGWVESKGKTGSAGEIFGRKVSFSDFGDAYGRMRLLGGRQQRITPDDVWNRLIQIKMAKKLGIKVSDDEVREYVLDEFGGGELTPEAYKGFLKRVGMSPEQFERTIREELLLAKMRTYLAESLKVSPAKVWHDYKRDNDSFRVQYVEVPFGNFEETAKEPTEEEIELYYEENKESFREPERVKIGYIAALVKKYEDSVVITGQEVKDYYEEHKEDYIAEEEEAAGVHIDEDGRKYKEVKTEGGSFRIYENDGEEAAEKASEEKTGIIDTDTGESGALKDEVDNKKAAEDQAAQEEEQVEPSKEGMVSEDEKTAGEEPIEYKPLEEVRQLIEEKLKRQKAEQLAEDQLYELVIKAEEEEKNPKELLKEYPLLVYEETDYFSRAEASRIKDIGMSRAGNKSFAEMAFGLEKGTFSDTISNYQKDFFVFEVLDKKESYISELAAKRDEIIERLREREISRLAREKAREILDKLKKADKKPEEVIQSEKGLKLVTTDKFYKRNDYTMPFPASVIDLEPNQWSEPEPRREAYYVARVVEIKEASREDFLKEEEKHKQNSISRKKNMFLWLELPRDITKRANLKDNIGSEQNDQR